MRALHFVEVLLVFGVVLQTVSGESLKCYVCSTKKNEGCYNPKGAKIEPVVCGMQRLDETKRLAAEFDPKLEPAFDTTILTHHPLMPINCIKQVFKVGNKEHILRGCQLEATEQQDICNKVKTIKTDHYRIDEMIHCSLCNSDYCNSSHYLNPSMLLLLSFQLFVFVLVRCVS